MAPEPNTDHAGRPQHHGDAAMEQPMTFSEKMAHMQKLWDAQRKAEWNRDIYARAIADYVEEGEVDSRVLDRYCADYGKVKEALVRACNEASAFAASLNSEG